ncbi:hypothetical protein [Halopiger aswanensis]|uniref:Uncharacterized protein n=1 Tax=Halopiger aswanensis TaxID=148449 RepID=A0A3R7HK68_9EURY|nr:hypothetical protein [Halopiger aswanensis]RKD97535.1 hypothetical protein ATJ93_0523 [Halopiger aswanensis]
MSDAPSRSLDDDSPPGIEDPEQLCDAIVELVDALEAGDLLDEEQADELRSDVYSSVELVELPEEEE